MPLQTVLDNTIFNMIPVHGIEIRAALAGLYNNSPTAIGKLKELPQTIPSDAGQRAPISRSKSLPKIRSHNLWGFCNTRFTVARLTLNRAAISFIARPAPLNRSTSAF